MPSLYEVLRESLVNEVPVSLTTVIDGPHLGAKLLIRPNEEALGSLGDPDLDRVVTRDARAELESGTTGVRHYGARGEANETTVTVFIESFAPPPQMIIFGAVDFTAALGRVAKILGYRVVVCDAREVFATKKRFPMADEVIVDWPNRVFDRVGSTLGPRDAVCILTHDPKFDVPAVTGALASRAGYIGVMGSRKTHAKRLERLVEEGVDLAEFDARVMSPIGLDIGARSPEETAVSICAEIIARRTGRTPPSLRDREGPIPLEEALVADDDLEAIREGVRRVCSKFDGAYWRHHDEAHEFPWDFYNVMAEGGWVGIAIPEEWGGGGRGITEAAAVLEEVAASGAAMNGASALHLSIFGMNPVVKHGSDHMKAEYLPRVACGELHVAFGVTEPDAGTDTTRITTSARLDGDHYIVRGRKVWTTKAPYCQKVLLLVRTTPIDQCQKRTDGLTLLLADLQRPEVEIVPIPKAGRNAVVSCEVRYDDLPVAISDRVGEEGQGFRYLLDGLNPERILVAAEAIGIGQVALARAVAYANDRVVFDRPIGKNQGIAFPLAEAHARLHAAKLVVYEAAARYDQGLPCGEHANLAKWLAADAGYQAADQAVQTHGGFGYAKEYDVERWWREARLMRIAPISQELVLAYVAEHVLGLPRSY